MAISREDFIDLIPHAGRMCLIDEVASWDDERLAARSGTHREHAHPLRRDGRLAAVHALEYAAQAMAIHGALLAARAGGELPPGFLAGARGLQLHVDHLDDIAADLDITVDRQFVQGGDLIYGFRVAAAGRALAEGTATVIAR